MKSLSKFIALGLMAVLAAFALPRPANADGAASTRNIIFGAAAVGGTLLILNHNKKVHQKYAEYEQRQATTQAEANQAQAAYQSERGAYEHEASLVADLQHEVAYQHTMVVQRDRQIASLTHSLIVAKYHRNEPAKSTAFVQPAHASVAANRRKPAVRVLASRRSERSAPDATQVSYGWGSF